MSTIFASYADPSSAEKAIGALLDNGAAKTDLSLVLSHHGPGNHLDSGPVDSTAKTGLSTTTGADAAAGALKGTVLGIELGILAALATLFIPGVGLVVGGGALATALAGVAGTTLAGTAVGSVTGYLVDQGMNEDQACVYSTALESGGAIVAIALPTGAIDVEDVEAILTKYGALNVATYHSMSAQPGIPVSKPDVPLEFNRVDPIAVVTAGGPSGPTIKRQVTTVENPVTGEIRQKETVSRQEGSQSKTVYDPLTGQEKHVLVEPEPVVVQNETVVIHEQPHEPLVSVTTEETVLDPVTGRPVLRVTKETPLQPASGFPISDEEEGGHPYLG